MTLRLIAIATALLLTGCSDDLCTSNEDCDGNFVCNPESEAETVDAVGCLTRCETNSDCAAGTVCQYDGTCS